MRKRRQDERDYSSNRGGDGYSKAAFDALVKGEYGNLTGRQVQYHTSQEQTQQAKSLPVLKGVSIPTNTTENFESSFSRKNHVDTDNARRKYAERIEYKPLGQVSQSRNDDNYVVKRDRYDKLMQNGRLADDIKSLWLAQPDGYGAEIVPKGYKNYEQFRNQLSKRYELTEKELDDMVKTYGSDVYGESLQRDRQMLQDFSKKHPVAGTLTSFLGTIGGAAEGAVNAVGGLLTNDDRRLSRTMSNIKGGLREGAKENIDSNVGKTAYDIGTGVGDMVAGAALGNAPLVLAGNTANEAMSSAMDRGSSVRRSAVYGTAAGALDYVTNKVGLDKAKKLAVDSIKSTGIKKFLAQNAIAGLGEAGENVLQDIGQSFIDAIVNGNNAELSKSYSDKIASGMSDSDAFKETAKEYAAQLGLSAGIGFGMGSAMQAGKSTLPHLPGMIADKWAESKNLGAVDPELQKYLADAMNQPEITQNNVNSDVENRWGRTADNLISPDSYARSKEFNDLERRISDQFNEIKSRKARIDELRNELNKEYVAKPEEERTSADDILSMFWGDDGELTKPTKRGEEIQSEINRLQQEINDINAQRNILIEDRDYQKANERLSRLDNYESGEFVPAQREDYVGFDTSKGGMADDLKSGKAKLVEMSPEEYIRRCAFEIFGDDFATIESVLSTREQGLIDKYAQSMREGARFDTPYLDYTSGNQEGLHRALAAYEAGIDTMPVMVKGNPSDNEILGFGAKSRISDIKHDRFKRELNENPIDDDVLLGDEDIAEIENSFPAVEGVIPPTDNGGGNVPPNDGDRVRSFSKRGSNDETLPDEIRNTLSEDYYKVVRNADTEARANDMFNPDDLIQTRSNLDRAVEAHDPAAALLSYKLAKAYVDNGNYDAATDVLQNVSAELTRMGQFTQAAKLAMLQNDPMAALRTYMRDLEKLNQWGSKKYKNKWNNLELSEDDINLINSIEKGDSEGLNAAFDALNEKFAKQIPASWWDKAVSASKTAMLLNLRTQSRNILANVASLPLRSASDRVSAVGQNIVHLFKPDMKVTQSVTGGTKAQKDIAGQIFDRLKDDITGENKMKDSVKSKILSQRQIFNDDFLAKWIDNHTKGGIQKLNQKFGANGNQSTMETLANLTYWLMGDVGDTPFVKKNFVNRLASYMKAQGIDNIDDVPDEAIAIATQEALKATFKDDNAFSKALQGIKQKSGKFGEVALPFVKTPANLTMRAIDYSPAGLINTFRKIRSDADASAVIDDLSKNLTGTALIYLGYKLAEKGLLSGSYSSGSDEAAFQKQQGMLENAIHIGDNYYTYDWTQPASTPLLLGQTIYEAVKASDKENASIEDVVNATYKGGLKVANTIINSSPLQSLSDLLGDSQYGDEGVAENIANEIMEFPQRFIPSVVGATARVVDPTIRDTYIKDTSLTGALGNQARQAMAKVPYLSKMLPASYDTWGNERTRSDSQGEAFFAQMVNPGQLGNKNETPLDAEIQRIYDATGNSAVFPIKADRSYNLGNDGTVTLTNQQHSDYQRIMGQRSYSYAESIMNNPEYKNLSDDDKANILDKAYKLSNALTKEEMFNHVTDTDKKLKEVARKGSADDVAQYLVDGVLKKSDKATKSETTASTSTPKTTTPATNTMASTSAVPSVSDFENTDHYKKVAAKAGEQSAKLQKDFPALKGMGLPDSADYVYANAIKKNPNMTVPEFAQTYKEMDTDSSNKLTQKEVLAYINAYQLSDDPDEDMKLANELWNTYQDGTWKKSLYLKKDGTYGIK